MIIPKMVANVHDARDVGRALREQRVDMVLMYHASYIDDAMTTALLDEIGDIFAVLLQSQSFRSFVDLTDLTEAGRSWGNNSSVQLPGTLMRLKPGRRIGYVFGGMNNARALREIGEYARAARAVRNHKGKRIGFSRIAVLVYRCMIRIPTRRT